MKTFKQFLSEAKDEYQPLYHVTHTSNVKHIHKGGIKPGYSTNWTKQGSGRAYGKGHIYAFEHEHDAHRWASHMEWHLHQSMGKGRVSVVKFKGNMKHWSADKADPIHQSHYEGRWLRSKTPVHKKHIESSHEFTSDHARALVKQLKNAS